MAAGRWYQVTIGVDTDAALKFFYRINGQWFFNGIANCTGGVGGGAGARNMIPNGQPLGIGGANRVAFPFTNVDLDEVADRPY